jgi:hypothetical protein
MSKGTQGRRNQQRMAAREAQRRKRRLLWIVAGVLVALASVGGIAWAAWQSNQPAPGEAVVIQGRDHIQPGQSHPPYNSDPPTSGWHYDQPVRAGFYSEPLPDEELVHNLEHGHVVISYDCSKLTDCDSVKAKLQALVDRFQDWKVVAVARENADAPIALTAWGRIDKLNGYDENRIAAFINYWRDRGPEATPD